MKRSACLYAVGFTLGLVACAALARPVQYIDAATVGPLILDVCDQHDESVERDPLLVAQEKEQALRSTMLVRQLVLEAQGRK